MAVGASGASGRGSEAATGALAPRELTHRQAQRLMQTSFRLNLRFWNFYGSSSFLAAWMLRFLLAVAAACALIVSSAVVNERVERTLDLTFVWRRALKHRMQRDIFRSSLTLPYSTHLVKEKVVVTVKNTGSSAVTKYDLAFANGAEPSSISAVVRCASVLIQDRITE